MQTFVCTRKINLALQTEKNLNLMVVPLWRGSKEKLFQSLQEVFSMSNNEILDFIGDPIELEKLYHTDPKQFHSWLSDELREFPESETLKVWNVRLTYSTVTRPANPANNEKLVWVIIVSLLSWFLVKLPDYFPISQDWFYPRFVPLTIFSALITYFLFNNDTIPIRYKQFILSAITLCVIVMFFMPDEPKSASIIMSQIHMPFVLSSLLALSYMSNEWKTSDARLQYIRYIGEVVIYTTLILIGGMILTALTLALFELIGPSIEKFYMNNVVVLGLVASPIVATYLYDTILNRESRLATLIANIFAPLFLITITIYLLAMFYAAKNPYLDRDFLITFNGLLILVWGITVFSISGKDFVSESKFSDFVNVALVSVTLIINMIALSAILFRLTEYGMTPNRLVVTGANILMFVHLILILVEYIKQLKTTTNPEKLKQTIASYLPIYSAWSVFIVILLPILFQFK